MCAPTTSPNFSTSSAFHHQSRSFGIIYPSLSATLRARLPRRTVRHLGNSLYVQTLLTRGQLLVVLVQPDKMWHTQFDQAMAVLIRMYDYGGPRVVEKRLCVV